MKSNWRLRIPLIVSAFTVLLFCLAMPALATDSTNGAHLTRSNVVAAVGPRTMPPQTTNDFYRPWHIKFSRPVEPGSINTETITVTDKALEVKIPIALEISGDGKTVTCKPENSYSPGQYRLVITKGVKAANDGPYLGQMTVMNFTVEAISSHISSLTLTADPEYGQDVNQPVILTAAAVGGKNVQYEFRVRPEDGEWQVIQDFSSLNTCTWTTDKAGTYFFWVGVHSAGSSIAYEKEAELPCYAIRGLGPSCKLWADPLPPQPAGTPITLHAISHGIDPPEYTYLVVSKDETTAEEVIECYVPQTSVTWVPLEAGRNYHLRLWVGYLGSKKGTVKDDIYFQTQ